MKNKQFVIGITGGSGVGKTTLIDILYKTFKGKITTLSLDNYYKPKELQIKDKNGVINFDLPSALFTQDLKEDLNELFNQKAIKQKVYHFNQPHKVEEYKIIKPKDILIVEGLFVMHYSFIRNKLDYSVYLSVEEEVQMDRRLKRDVQERNYDRDEVLYQWKEHVLPAYKSYIQPYKDVANIIITNNKNFDSNIETLIETIKRELS
ncbi:MAG: uridine kinase [Crocinitomicaceae bacterium]